MTRLDLNLKGCHAEHGLRDTEVTRHDETHTRGFAMGGGDVVTFGIYF